MNFMRATQSARATAAMPRGNAKERPCCRSRMASVTGLLSPVVSRVYFLSRRPCGGVPAGSISRLNVFGDNLSWVSGRHTFKFGGEVRFGSGDDAFVDIGVTPTATFGAGGVAVTGLRPQTFRASERTRRTAQNLLINLSGSLRQCQQRFYTTGGANPVYEAIQEGQHADGDIFQREFSAFFKDDWKVRPEPDSSTWAFVTSTTAFHGLSANNQGGGTPSVVGGSSGLFGLSGTSFADLYQPGRLNGIVDHD